MLRAYSLARSHLGRHEGLSPIYESALEWQENQFISLLGWIEGTPLSEFAGVFPLLAEEQDEPSAESLAVRFLQRTCQALDVLHRNGLTHGDVSPRNLIVSGNSLVLTDYDFVTRIGDPAPAPGTVVYCCPSRQQKNPTKPCDDLFALAASFFHVLFEKEPFRYSGEFAKERGLNWSETNRAEYPILAEILNRATHPDPDQRYTSATEMLQALRKNDRATGGDMSGNEAAAVTSDNEGVDESSKVALTEQRVDWLKSLLQSYPGSR